MKKLCLALVLHLLIYGAHAQNKDSANHLRKLAVAEGNESRLYSGFKIKLFSNQTQGYHFDISNNEKTVPRHFQNPLPFSPAGIQKKEDAFKIAQWIINTYQKTGHWENMVPPHIARRLGIEFTNE
jgi:hypothetical protein